MLITLEGVDGVGKDTVAIALKERLVEEGHDPRRVHIVNEPSTIGLGAIVRRLVVETDKPFNYFSQLGLLCAARADNLLSTIIPMIEQDGVVICTRGTLSSMVYQLPNIPLGLQNAALRIINSTEAILVEHSIHEVRIELTCPIDRIVERITSRGLLDPLDTDNITIIKDRAMKYYIHAKKQKYTSISNDRDVSETVDEIMSLLTK